MGPLKYEMTRLGRLVRVWTPTNKTYGIIRKTLYWLVVGYVDSRSCSCQLIEARDLDTVKAALQEYYDSEYLRVSAWTSRLEARMGVCGSASSETLPLRSTEKTCESEVGRTVTNIGQLLRTLSDGLNREGCMNPSRTGWWLVVWYRGYLISADGLGWCIVYRMHSNGTGECVVSMAC